MDVGGDGTGDRLRVALVGTGLVGRRHLAALAGMADVEVVAIADRSPDVRAAVATEVRCAAYDDGLTLLEREDLDAVWLCVPPFAHGPLEMLAVEQGIPFFVEKPISLEASMARDIAAAVHERGLVAAVGYQWRHLDTVRRARELLASSPAQLALAEWSSKMPRAPWWRTNALSGGQILEQGTHLFDLVRHLVDEPVRVFGASTGPVPCRRPPADVAAGTAVTLELEGGGVAVVTTTCLLARPHRIGIRLFGDGLLIELSETAMAVESNGNTWQVDAAVEPFAEEDREFVDAVRASRAGGAPTLTVPYEEALRTHVVVLAAVEAMRTGGFVDVAGTHRG